MATTLACAGCGSPLEGGDAFCTSCGAKAGKAPVATATRQPFGQVPLWPIDDTQPGSGYIKTAWAFTALGVLAGILAFVGVFFAYKARKMGHPQGDGLMALAGTVGAVMFLLTQLLFAFSL